MSWPRFLRRDDLRRCFDSTRYVGRSRAESGYLPRQSESGQGAIRHPRVQIEEAAGVDAFLMGEPWPLPGGGYGPVAAEAYGVAGAIFIVFVPEVEAVRGEVKIFGGHEWPAFTRRNFAAIHHSTLRLPLLLHEVRRKRRIRARSREARCGGTFDLEFYRSSG
jgi:hypothetical protein